MRVVNACRDPDLFWALKGGGAGFGITTRLTLATRALPDRFGYIGRTIEAKSDAAFRHLIDAFCRFAHESLVNIHWGEKVRITPDNKLEIAMVFQGLSDDAARAVWKPFWNSVANNPDIATMPPLQMFSLPAQRMWDYDYLKKNLPDAIITDDRPDAVPGRFWWAGDGSQVSAFLSNYESAWLPAHLLAPRRRAHLVNAMFTASRLSHFELHMNKGLAAADPARRAEARAAAIHPSALDAFALAVIAGGQRQRYPGVIGHEPDLARARADAKKIAAATKALRRVAPSTGSYSSEMGFFAKNWRQAAWGRHYPRLLAIKKKYDPEGLFTGHHQVGSEHWSEDGFTRLR